MNYSQTAVARIVFFAVTLFVLAACGEGVPIKGEVASVNGQVILYQDLEARRSFLFTGRSSGAVSFDEATLQIQYRYVLRRMIEEALILQHMDKQGYALDPALCEAEERRIRADYPEGAFEETLVEEGLNLEQWREDIVRRLRVEQFLELVFRPEISISTEEVEQYYREHRDEFVIPEQWHFMRIVGSDATEVTNAGKALVASKDAAAVQKKFLVTINDIRMGKDLLPETILKRLAGLKPWQASRTRADGAEFHLFVLLDETPASMVDAAEISRRVERALVEEKIRSLYAVWIEKQAAKARISIAPTLIEPIRPFEAEKRSAGEILPAPRTIQDEDAPVKSKPAVRNAR